MQGIARVDVDVGAKTVSCILLSSYQRTSNVTCSITYGPTTNCSQYTGSSSVTSGLPNSTLTIPLAMTPGSGEEFCYTVQLPHGSSLLSITGTFRSGQKTHVVYCMSEVTVSSLLFSYRYCVFMYPLQHVMMVTGVRRC